MNNFVKTYLERDLPALGFPADRVTGEHLWTMLAHYHGSLVNYAEIGKSLDLGIHTIKKYVHFLENAFLILHFYLHNNQNGTVKRSIHPISRLSSGGEPKGYVTSERNRVSTRPDLKGILQNKKDSRDRTR